MRNVELKARDPDPARTLERALALGADDRGEIKQRDTYFARRRGRLKLREQRRRVADVGRADRVLARADRTAPDSTEARASEYRRVPVADAAPLHEALDAAYGTLVTSRSGGGCCSGRACASTSTRSRGSARYMELEAVAEPDSDLTAEREKVERLRAELGIEDENLIAGSYSDLLLETAPGARCSTRPARRR